MKIKCPICGGEAFAQSEYVAGTKTMIFDCRSFDHQDETENELQQHIVLDRHIDIERRV